MRSKSFLSAGISVLLLAASSGYVPADAEGIIASPGAVRPQSGAGERAPKARQALRARSALAPRAADENHDLRRKIGQMILVGFVGNNTGDAGFETVRQQLEAGEITGVLYLERNLTEKSIVSRMNSGLAGAVPAHLSPLIAIDQEGGAVQRLQKRHRFPATLSARDMAKVASPSEAATAYGVLAKNLASWGFNLNLGPVVDLNSNPRNPIIGSLGRAYSKDPDTVAKYGAAFVDGHRSHGVLSTLKHFPGHGSSRADSHKGEVDVTGTWSQDELEPFRRLIADDRADLVMTAHVRNRSLQDKGEKVPISMSSSALSGVLRHELGFDGVIISDDMQMEAIRSRYSFEDAILHAVNAGTDILIYANDRHPDPEIPGKIISVLMNAAQSDPKLRLKIEAAYRRVLGLKSRLNAQPVPKPTRARSNQTLAKATPEESRVLTPEDVDAAIRSVRLIVPKGLSL